MAIFINRTKDNYTLFPIRLSKNGALEDSPCFYGWKLAVLGFFANVMIQGGGIYILNALIEPLSELHGWSRGDMGTSLAVASCLGMLSISVFSSLALRVPLRILMAAGSIMGAFGFWIMGQTSSLNLFTAGLTAIWVGGQACGGAVANALMSNWFVRHRGKAFGLVNMGTSMSGAILPMVALLLLHEYGVPATTFVLALVTLILLPASLLLVRETPESMGLYPDGLPSQSINIEQGAPRTIIPWKTLTRMPECYRLGLIFGFGLMIVAGVVGQLKPRFSDLGFSEYVAMSLMALTALCAALGKYIWGWITDKVPPIKATRLLILSTIDRPVFCLPAPASCFRAAFRHLHRQLRGGILDGVPRRHRRSFRQGRLCFSLSFSFPLRGHEIAGLLCHGRLVRSERRI